jgi:adenine-specific DNA-methyltransferase
LRSFIRASIRLALGLGLDFSRLLTVSDAAIRNSALFSNMTELIWDGKYKDGKKQGPVRIALPFQTIETVNESTQDRRRSLELFTGGRDTEWRNRLIWGDKKYVLPSLQEQFSGQVNLVYIDPPFFTGTDQQIVIKISDNDFFEKEPSLIEEAAYRNVWRHGTDSFCKWIYDTLLMLQQLLAPQGWIFIRYDQYWSHYVKVIADEVFDKSNFHNEIVVNRIHKNVTQQGSISIPIATDSLFLYSKDAAARFLDIKKKLDKPREGFWRHMDDSSGVRHPPERRILGQVFYPPAGKHFKFGQTRVDEMLTQGKIRLNEKTGRPEYWVETSYEVILDSDWTDIPGYSFTTGYPTENSESLLERVIKACSRPGDLVLDCFAGSGTTAASAEKLGRRWITCDIGRYSIHTVRKRLLGISGVKPFVVQNLGKYERQAWQTAEFPSNGKDHLEEQRERETAYRKFILELYHATPMSGHAWLHGTKSGRMVHVAAVDAPVTQADVKAIAREAWKTIASGKDSPTKAAVDILGWEFALEVNELAKNVAAESRVDVAFKKIPREVLDKKAIEQGDVKFFELGALSVNVKQKARDVILKLTDFVIPTDDIPEEARKAIKHWSQLVDYWAVDWDYKNDTFHNQWQAYRTRKEPKIELETKYEYKEPGTYQIVVKVIDILGNDTTKTLEVTVK